MKLDELRDALRGAREVISLHWAKHDDHFTENGPGAPTLIPHRIYQKIDGVGAQRLDFMVAVYPTGEAFIVVGSPASAAAHELLKSARGSRVITV